MQRSLTVAFAVLAMSAPQAFADDSSLGNAWHLPAGSEPGIPSMRHPVRPGAGDAVTVVSGNQFRGSGGNPGNQLGIGSAVVYRRGDGDWRELPMTFHSTAGNNKYFSAQIPGTEAGELIDYYFRLPYSDHATTFVHAGPGGTETSASEEGARQAPFGYVVTWPLEPRGAYRSIEAGGREARIYVDSGHIALARTTAGGASETVVALLPRVERDGRWQPLGAVTSVARRDGALTAEFSGVGGDATALITVERGAVQFRVTDWHGAEPTAVELAAATRDDERFFGFGEKFNAVDQTGREVRILGVDAPGEKGDRSYKAVPWALSSRGYGLHLDTTREAVFDLGNSDASSWHVQYRGSELGLALFDGPTIRDALARYTAHVGRPPVPPVWTFSPWLSSDHWRDGGEVRYVVTRYRELGLSGSVFVFDSPWEVAYNDFQWNTEQFSRGGRYEGRDWAGFDSPQEMLRFLDDNGFRVVMWLTPFINVESNDEGVPGQNTGKASTYDEAAANGYLVKDGDSGEPVVVTWWKGDGSPVDFTNPKARSWFQEQLRSLVVESDGVIAGFKTDDGESDFIPLSARYFDGRTGADMKNGYSVEYHRAVWEVLGEEGVLLSRSGHTGSQAFPAHWSGDNEPNFGQENGLASVVTAGISAGLSGFSIWGHDVGGYLAQGDSPTPEALFSRWTQFGALSPIMQLHRQVSGENQYPWSYGAAALENFRRYTELHTRLVPLFYQLAHEARDVGLPIVRHPALSYPELAGETHDYMLGDELLVAPILDATGQRSISLPPGVWYDFQSGERHQGGSTILWSSTDPHRTPLFAREGAIVPLLHDPPLALGDSVPTSLTFRVYPGSGEEELSLYDGTRLHVAPDAGRLELELSGPAAPIRLEIYGAWRSESATASSDGFTIAELTHPGGTTRLTLSPPTTEERPAATSGTGSPGGGCATHGGASSVSALLLLLALLSRRRRPTVHG